ncbi:MAG: polyprenyl synthetase family protein [Rikenellaceae bacterium]
MQLTDIQAPIKEQLTEFDKLLNNSLKHDVELVTTMSDYVLSMQGKHMRPLFLLLSASLHGDINEKCHNAAIFIELIHTASLIHDDVVDEAYMRRSKSSVNALMRSKAAVLLGDYVLSRGLKIAVKNKLYSTIDMVSQVIEEMSVGELMQSANSVRLNTTSQDYFDVVRRKTALLMACCGASGAESVGADKQSVERMFKFGELLGIAFQIKDDILDFNGETSTGKSNLNDVRERKLTLPLLTVMEKLDSLERKKILALLREPIISESSVSKIRDYVFDNGGIEQAQNKMTQLKEEAVSLLDIYPDSPVKRSLIMYADFILTRNK